MVAVHIFVVASLLMLSEKSYLRGCENLVSCLFLAAAACFTQLHRAKSARQSI